MRHHQWMALALLVAGSVLAVGQPSVADDTQVAAGIANQLNAQWEPNAPAFTADSVAQQRGPDKFGGWGGVRIGNLISIAIAKATLANTPNPTPQQISQALLDAQAAVMAARQGPGPHGWGFIAQDKTGQKLGALLKGAQPGNASATGQSLSLEKGGKGAQKSAEDKATGKTAFSSAFDTSTPTGVAFSGPGVGTGHGHDKDAGAQGVAGKDGGQGQGEGHGGGNGGGGGKGK